MPDCLSLDLVERLASKRNRDHARDGVEVGEGDQLAVLQFEMLRQNRASGIDQHPFSSHGNSPAQFS